MTQEWSQTNYLIWSYVIFCTHVVDAPDLYPLPPQSQITHVSKTNPTACPRPLPTITTISCYTHVTDGKLTHEFFPVLSCKYTTYKNVLLFSHVPHLVPIDNKALGKEKCLNLLTFEFWETLSSSVKIFRGTVVPESFCLLSGSTEKKVESQKNNEVKMKVWGRRPRSERWSVGPNPGYCKRWGE